MNENSGSDTHPPSGQFPYIRPDLSPDHHDDAHARLQNYDFRYMLAVARYICTGVSETDLQDIALEALYAFSCSLKKNEIRDPEAYIAQIVRRKFLDYLRRKQRDARLPTVSISTFEDSPDMQIPSPDMEGLIDPANEIDEQMALNDVSNDLAAAIVMLPSRQQRAMICWIVEKAPNPFPLILALKARNIAEIQMHWPQDNDEKRVLQASLPAARQALANFLHIDLSQYKPLRRPHPPIPPDD